jgi:hypothetical protein
VEAVAAVVLQRRGLVPVPVPVLAPRRAPLA